MGAKNRIFIKQKKDVMDVSLKNMSQKVMFQIDPFIH